MALRHGGTWETVRQYIADHTSLMMFWYVIEDPNGVFYPIHVPFWFIRDLIVMVALSPLIYLLLRLCVGWLRYIFLLILTAIYIFGLWPAIPGLSVQAVVFFTLGAFIAKGYAKECITLAKQCRHIAYSVSVVLLSCTLVRLMTQAEVVLPVVTNIFVASGVASVFLLADDLANKKSLRFNKLLVDSTFFIFAFHMFVLATKSLLGDLLDIYPPENPYALIALYFINPIVVIAISVGAYWFIRKYMPMLCKVLTGK